MFPYALQYCLPAFDFSFRKWLRLCPTRPVQMEAGQALVNLFSLSFGSRRSLEFSVGLKEDADLQQVWLLIEYHSSRVWLIGFCLHSSRSQTRSGRRTPIAHTSWSHYYVPSQSHGHLKHACASRPQISRLLLYRLQMGLGCRFRDEQNNWLRHALRRYNTLSSKYNTLQIHSRLHLFASLPIAFYTPYSQELSLVSARPLSQSAPHSAASASHFQSSHAHQFWISDLKHLRAWVHGSSRSSRTPSCPRFLALFVDQPLYSTENLINLHIVLNPLEFLMWLPLWCWFVHCRQLHDFSKPSSAYTVFRKRQL